MSIDIAQIKQEFKDNTSIYLYEKYLVGNDVWYLKDYLRKDNHSQIYDEFKKYIARKFELQYNDIGIFGSAKTGFSFSPDNDFSLFDSNPNKASDIDLVLVSKKHFDYFWEAYQDKYNNGFLPKYENVTSGIFRKFITFEGFREYNDPIYAEWLKKVGGYQKEIQLEFEIEHKINYRIYESWHAAYLYYINSIKKIKNKL